MWNKKKCWLESASVSNGSRATFLLYGNEEKVFLFTSAIYVFPDGAKFSQNILTACYINLLCQNLNNNRGFFLFSFDPLIF